MEEDATYADDIAHPIPCIGVCDVHGVKKGGGATLSLVIATPLGNDLRSRQRLVKKIERYLHFIKSAEFDAECGRPNRENTSISVHIHQDSDPEIFTLIEDCRGWIEDNDASLEVKFLPSDNLLQG